ncbi:MAG: NUDIX hydrolase [Pseudomonadota bacterium]|nr:NUDIX hydrolase [Pseudomonadota bacterium]
MTTPPWLHWARALQAISQTGLHFAQDPYDRERYRQIAAIAADILARHSNLTAEQVHAYSTVELGYATPKVDVRGVAFRDDKVLLVREVADQGRWTLPGGWADVNESPGESVAREVLEESGFVVRPVKLLAAYDRDRHGHSPTYPYHVYKLFFLCEITGGEARPNLEASEIAFFGEDELPELSQGRVREHQLRRFFDHYRHPQWPTDFD